ncbi:MAG: FAD:protein FMN transferase [Carnobacterium sp.]|uniref:FAD:protein FMN transferase n=1 Tax=Carnobacterium sp. TaxID=48221 RepID=UPI0019116E58|nr:FAD:protein FMN transferase [Carnobacterium sp. CS13]QQP71518.1 FAD:protein FMN transferase [Carnobacterium sp. CS13]
MGTVIDLLVQHETPGLVLDELVIRLKEYEHRFSANDSSSELMAINKNAGIQPVPVHPDLYQLIKIGKHHSCSPASNLNIAIGPLVQTWRIGFDDAKVPAAEDIQLLLKKTDPQNIVLNDEAQTVFLRESGMLIDLGSLAKGFIADLLIDYLKSVGTLSALINLGGNIVVLGPSPTNKDHHWKIGIRRPGPSRDQSMVALKALNQSIVTSGIYERSLSDNEQTYHHILDPHTGYPIETDVASLTIVSDKSIDGEIWTTRLFGKSSEEIMHILNQLEGIDGLLITKEEKMLYSAALEDKIIKMN